MDNGDAIKIAQKYIQSISAIYNIKDAILFGSHAKGTNRADSDIDIALVLNDVHDIIETQIELMKLRRNIDLRIEPHPFKSEDFSASNPVVNEIIKHGVALNVH